MGHLILPINNTEEWHEARSKGIGGSDAAAILGLNPFKTNVDLWKEKTGRKTPEDISQRPAVIYGKKAEEFLRQLFMLDYPQYTLKYSPFDQHINETYKFIRASLDGVLTDQNGEKGILEIKTTEILNPQQWKKWENRIPNNYFCQVLHYFAVDEDFKFCKLKAKIKYQKDNEVAAAIRHYHLSREDFKQDIEELINKEIEFWQYVEKDIEPPLLLPPI